jgi:aminopeptidase N
MNNYYYYALYLIYSYNSYATTHFEPVDARRAFPCFDEPAMKAKFQMTMIRHKNFTNTLFNAPLNKTIDHPTLIDWKIDQFDESLLMSSYLVAFVVSNFETIKSKSDKYNINIEVSARPEAILNGEGDFGLIDSGLVLDYFSDYFNIQYPMSKSSKF